MTNFFSQASQLFAQALAEEEVDAFAMEFGKGKGSGKGGGQDGVKDDVETAEDCADDGYGVYSAGEKAEEADAKEEEDEEAAAA